MVETLARSLTPSSAKPQIEPPEKRSVLLRLISSTTIITILLFAAINFAVEKYDPLEHLFWTGLTGARQHIFVSKLPRLMTASKSPDVLVLGSSVSLYPAVRADDDLAGRKARWDFWYERNVILPYDKVQFLEHHLSEWSGQPVSVSNASVAGSLISDQYLILKKFLATGKKTRALVVCLSPRDFLDNGRLEIDNTPTYNVLGDWSSLPELFSNGASWQSITDVALGNFSEYYRHRQEYSQFVTNLTAQTLKRPVSLYEATRQTRAKAAAPPAASELKPAGKKRDTFYNPSNTAVFIEPPNTLYHLDEYKKMYLPLSAQQFAAQTDYFNKFLRLAAKNNIPVLVVSTPLPVENTGILPRNTLEQYRKVLADGCAATGATLLVPNEEQSYETARDFEDASHMNTSGGIKFYTSILEALKREPKLSANFPRK
jgi:hypothetical protein